MTTFAGQGVPMKATQAIEAHSPTHRGQSLRLIALGRVDNCWPRQAQQRFHQRGITPFRCAETMTEIGHFRTQALAAKLTPRRGRGEHAAKHLPAFARERRREQKRSHRTG